MRVSFTMGRLLELCILLFSFFLPFARSGISLFAVLILLLFPFAAGKNKLQTIFSQPATRAILAYAAFVALSLLWTEHFETGIQNLKNNGHLLLIPIMFTTLSSNGIKNALKAFGAGLLVHLVAGYLGFFGWLPNLGDTALFEPVYFMNRLDYVFILTIVSIFSLNRLLYKKKFTQESLLLGFFAAACLFTIFQLQARIAYFMLAAGLVLVPFLKFEGKQRIIATISSIVLVIVVFTAAFTFNQNFRKIVLHSQHSLSLLHRKAEAQYTTSWGMRIIAIKSGLELFQERPVFGYGVGDNIHVLREHLQKKKEQNEITPNTFNKLSVIFTNHFHNQYIEVLTQTGMAGLALMLWMFFTFWRMRPSEKSWNSFASIFLVMLFTGFIAEPYMQKQFTSAMVAFTTGLFLAKARTETKEEVLEEQKAHKVNKI